MDIIDSVEDTIAWFGQNDSPDLIFMDIQLADGLSFDIFQSVEIQCPIIFTTAFDQYAIKAFKVNSVDYLLKPIKAQDMKRALQKFENNYSSNQSSPPDMTALIAMIEGRLPNRREGVLVKEGSGFIQLKISDIHYLYSADSITFAITNGKRYIVDETLDQFLATVEDHSFFRINRSQAVSKSTITRIQPYLNHRLKLTVNNGGEQEFIVSRQRVKDFKEWMNG